MRTFHETLSDAFLAAVGCVQARDNPLPESEPSACLNCSIAIDSVTVLGADTDPSSISPSAGSCTVGRLRSGESVMSAPIGGGQTFVYSASGGPVIRTIERPRLGPTELGASLRLWVGPGDTYHHL